MIEQLLCGAHLWHARRGGGLSGWVGVVPADWRSEGIGFLSCRRAGEGVRKGAERKGLERLKEVREQQNLREL